MKIGAIQTFHISPVFTALNTNKPRLRKSEDSFDTFEKSTKYSFKRDVQNYHQQLSKEMGILTKKDIKAMAQRISNSTGLDRRDVYKVMGKLSSYSSYKSLDIFKKYIKDNQVSVISNLLPYYEPKNNKNWTPSLSNAMHYICTRNFGIAFDRTPYNYTKKLVFIDSELIEKIKRMSKKNRELFYKNFLERDNYQLVYFEDFENGYNFFNQGDDFEKFTTATINKAKKLQKINGRNINYNVSMVLNGLNYYNMKKLGIKTDIVKNKYPIKPEQIAKNLQPIIPNEQNMIKTLNDALLFSHGDKNENQKYMMKLIRNIMTVVTPHQYNLYLKSLHNKINNYLIENNYPLDKVYYLIPSIYKSYVLTNYQYQKANNIRNAKMIYLDKMEDEYKQLKEKLPENSTVIILDDTAISGLSYVEENFPYQDIAKKMKKSNNIRFIFAPMFATNYGINKIETIAKENSRKNIDKVICAKVLPELDKDIPLEFFSETQKKSSPYLTSLVLPYMGPDSNCEDLVLWYGNFLYWSGAQKPPLGIYD